MYKRKTNELERMLMSTHPSEIDNFVEANADEMMNGSRDFMKYMNQKLKEKKLRKQDVLLKADIPQGYGYKLLTEEKVTRQRDVILRICYAAELSLDETQQALRLYHMGTLYARDPRDALLMVCFNEHPGSIIDVNELLLKNNMQPLRSSGIQE
ncbi:MAG: hypothetical protein MR011_02780 [Lachnospiraceae bacterium]|nr:hypothetical protein [Lachnospiraceae bacterium]